MIGGLLVLAIAGIALACLMTPRCPPLTLLQRWALRLQGEWMWLVECAWPAVRSVRWQYEICATKCHRRVVEAAPPAQPGPVAAETFEPPPGSGRQTLRGWLKGLPE